ncbi:hypothetical protein [Aureivirga marina]|uniref:hypothetical protein n=1 Tax=Aureivirga marina TaxID=1182451 RepID=UPI0018CB4BDB|nr:hypothetical protein [Aureivirga marina]
MNKKYTLFVLFLLCTLISKAQLKKSMIYGFEYGKNNPTLENNYFFLDKELNSSQLKLNIGLQLETKNEFVYSLEYGLIYRFFSTIGLKYNLLNDVLVNVSQEDLNLIGRVGFGKNIYFSKKLDRFSLFLGVGLQAELNGMQIQRKPTGYENDYVLLTSNFKNKVSWFIQPEIAIRIRSKSRKSAWKLGARYNVSFAKNIMEGNFSHYNNQKLAGKVNFEVDGKMLALFFQLEFQMKNKKNKKTMLQLKK